MSAEQEAAHPVQKGYFRHVAHTSGVRTRRLSHLRRLQHTSIPQKLRDRTGRPFSPRRPRDSNLNCYRTIRSIGLSDTITTTRKFLPFRLFSCLIRRKTRSGINLQPAAPELVARPDPQKIRSGGFAPLAGAPGPGHAPTGVPRATQPRSGTPPGTAAGIVRLPEHADRLVSNPARVVKQPHPETAGSKRPPDPKRRRPRKPTVPD
jgi:hypothetical protein